MTESVNTNIDSLKSDASAAPAGETWRTFIAVELPDKVRLAAAGLRGQLPQQAQPLVRWVAPENIHITLRFLGDVVPARAVEVAGRLADVAARSGRLSLKASGAGAFPDFRSPRIFWVSFSGETQRLTQLQARVEGAMSALDFAPEREKFTPHATVGRTARDVGNRDAAALGGVWSRVKLSADGQAEFTVTSVTLFRSHLGPDVARYERLLVAGLG